VPARLKLRREEILMKKKFTLCWMLIALLVGLGGCAPQAAAPTLTSAAEVVTLKVVALPILDALPIFVAQDQGLFARYNLSVEFIPAGSAPERDQLIAAGQADAMINEVLSAMFFNKDSVRVQVVRYARAASSGSALFTILANKDSGVGAVADLKGKSIGVSEGTIIAYLTERMLAAEGLPPEQVNLVSVPKIDSRLALLNSGELQAAVLPEPLASAAALQGSIPILDDTRHPEYSFSTLTFRKEVLEQQPEAVRGYLRAIEDATDLINQEPDRWKQILVDQNILPTALVDQFHVPQFVKAGVPSETQYADALAWAKDKGYLTDDIPYADCVNGSFLPR
jgi:NitT/TauT family transport system substrate-binding protein